MINQPLLWWNYIEVHTSMCDAPADVNRRLKPLDDLYVLWIATLTVYSRILQQPFHPSTFPAQFQVHLSFHTFLFLN